MMLRRSFLKGIVGALGVIAAGKVLAEKPRMMTWRRYKKLPMATTPLSEGIVPTYRSLEREDHVYDCLAYSANRSGKTEFSSAEYGRLMAESMAKHLDREVWGVVRG